MSTPPFPGQPGQQPPYGAPAAPAGGPMPYVQQPSAPFAPGPTRGKRRTGLLVSGIVVLLAGLIGGGAMLVIGGTNYSNAVEDLARAPVGCTTSLEFDDTGTFTIFIETSGEVGNVRGDCANTDTGYDRGDDELPDAELTLVDEAGDELDLEDDDSKDYDIDGFAGQSVYRVDIEEPGTYDLTVSSDEDDFAIAIGKDPKSNATIAGIGLAVLIAGGVLGIVLIVLGLRRKPAPPSAGFGPGGAPYAPNAPTMQQPTHAPGAMVPPATFPPAAGYPPAPPTPPTPSYSPPPTAPMPTTPPPPAPPAPPASWSPPPPQP